MKPFRIPLHFDMYTNYWTKIDYVTANKNVVDKLIVKLCVEYSW